MENKLTKTKPSGLRNYFKRTALLLTILLLSVVVISKSANREAVPTEKEFMHVFTIILDTVHL